MHIFRNLTTQQSPCVLTIGNFDGVHTGHVALLHRLRKIADQFHLPAGVLTFSPHPRHYFAIKKGTLSEAPATITPFREKIGSIAKCQIDRITIARFTPQIAQLTAEDFVKQILVQTLNVKCLLIGQNFRFGKDRQGTTELLRELGKKMGFQVEVLPAVLHDQNRISSSAIRKLLKENNFKQANVLLGRPFSISGHVVHGNRIGHQLGIPTANLCIRHINPILSGVYITRIHGLGEPLPAVSMIGTRPTVTESDRIVLETHVLNFNENCYGSLVRVEFLKKLRDNQKFPDLDALKTAIGADIQAANDFFRELNMKPTNN